MKSLRTKWIIILSTLILTVACSAPKNAQKTVSAPITTPTTIVQAPVSAGSEAEDTFFENLFKSYPGKFDSILKYRKEWNVQIIYTQIDRDKSGLPKLTHHYFNKMNARYFYPASTVKFPVAVLALQRLNELKQSGIDKQTTIINQTAYSGQTSVFNDPNTPDGRPTIAQYIKKIFLVSDNDAFNRLYEFLGQEYINATLHKKGYPDAQILHRLDVFLTEDENRHTNLISFLDSTGRSVYTQQMLYNKVKYEKRTDVMGNGYYSNGKLINKPMVFGNKNRIALQDLHHILQSLIFPSSVAAAERFDITEEDRKFLLKYMSAFPSESVFPFYDKSYYDAYGKFIFYGAQKGSLPKNIRIFNKIGDAYGQMTDVAYVVDFEKKIEFMVSATIYNNTDGILNDDKYDYETIGLPFMKDLGIALYNYEMKRKRIFLPDLSSFLFTYDK